MRNFIFPAAGAPEQPNQQLIFPVLRFSIATISSRLKGSGSGILTSGQSDFSMPS